MVVTIVVVARTYGSESSKHAFSAFSPPAQEVKVTAPSLAKGGHTSVQPSEWIGYRDMDTLQRATRLAVEGDKAAYSKLMGNGVARGICNMLKPGEEVFVEDTAMFFGLVKIRREGETNGWWTNSEAVK